MSAIIKGAETTTYCYETYYFTKQSEIDFIAFQSSITDMLPKKKLSLHSFELKPKIMMWFYNSTWKTAPVYKVSFLQVVHSQEQKRLIN